MGGKLGTYDTNHTVSQELFLKNYEHPGIRAIWVQILENKVDANDIVQVLGGGDRVKVRGDSYFCGMSNEQIEKGTLVLSVLQRHSASFPDYVAAALSNMETYADKIEERGFAIALLGKKEVNEKLTTTLTTEQECRTFASDLKKILTTEIHIDPIVAESTVIKKVTSHLNAVSTFTASTKVDKMASEFKVVMSKQEGNSVNMSMYSFTFTSAVQITKNAGVLFTENKVGGEFTVICKTASFSLVPLTR